MCQVSEDYADLFCEVFDGIDAAEFHANGEGWLLDRGVQAAGAEVEEAALAGRPVEISHPFAALLGLDAALARANPLLGGSPPPALSEYALRYAESGRFDSGAGPGALLPRFARPGRRGQLPESLADAFGALVRVQASGLGRLRSCHSPRPRSTHPPGPRDRPAGGHRAA